MLVVWTAESYLKDRSNDKPFPFLRLPPELRYKVYSLVLVAPRPIWPDVDDWTTLETIDGHGLLTTCHLINAEACDILYGKNVFHFDDRLDSVCPDMRHVPNMNGIYSFFKDIGNRNRLWLRHISLEFWHSYFLFYEEEELHQYPDRGSYSRARILGKALQLLAKGHALKSLRITIRNVDNKDTDEAGQGYNDYPSWRVFMASKKIKQYFLDLKGIQEVDVCIKAVVGVQWVECARDEDKESIKAFKREIENSVP